MASQIAGVGKPDQMRTGSGIALANTGGAAS